MYLITAKYSGESDRKRIEYALEKWKERMKITKPEGIMAIVDGGDVEGLIEELYSRTEKDSITSYHIEKAHLDVAEAEKEIRLKIGEKMETTEKLIDFIMAKQKAVLKMEMAELREKVYEVYTKKGKAKISVGLNGGETSVNLHLRISGYGEAVDFLYRKLAGEFKLLDGQR